MLGGTCARNRQWRSDVGDSCASAAARVSRRDFRTDVNQHRVAQGRDVVPSMPSDSPRAMERQLVAQSRLYSDWRRRLSECRQRQEEACANQREVIFSSYAVVVRLNV